MIGFKGRIAETKGPFKRNIFYEISNTKNVKIFIIDI
jgi:hypothetical protein